MSNSALISTELETKLFGTLAAVTINAEFIYIFVYNINMNKHSNLQQLMDIAASQWSLFTSAQAVEIGISRTQLSRMAADGRIEPMTRGTWHIASAPETEDLAIKAAWLSLFPKEPAWMRLQEQPYDAVIVGRTAAVLHGDNELYPQPYAFAVRSRKRTVRNDIHLYAWHINENDIVIKDGLPAASFERTIADLVRLHEDPSLLSNVVRHAVERGETVDTKRLAELLAPLAARNGYAKGDGGAFANDITRHDIRPQQIARIAGEIRGALGNKAAEEFLAKEVS